VSDAYFVTGTDTDAGKTVFSAALMRLFASQGRRVAGLKPVASGVECVDGLSRNLDVVRLSRAANVRLPPERINRYHFEPAIAPHIAADRQGVALNLAAISEDVSYAMDKVDVVVVEGVGGWLVPLDQRNTIESLAMLLNLPVILVVGMRLGCLNHALLTAQAIERSGVPFLGWVSNHVCPDFSSKEENIAALESRIAAPRLYDLPYSGNLDECILKQVLG